MKRGLVRKLVYLGLVLCVIASMLAFACAEPEPEEPTPEEPTTEEPTTEEPTTEEPTTLTPQYGGTMRFVANWPYRDNIGYPYRGASAGFNSFMPLPCIETLLRADDNGNPIPWLITDWQWSDDYKSINLYLQEGVKFHDGTNFNAESVKYCLDKTIAAGTSLNVVTSTDVVDDYTLRLNVPQYSNTIINDLCVQAGSAGAISATHLQKYEDDVEYIVTHPVGTGPFKFVSFERDVHAKFEKFDDYWQEGKPYLDKVEYILIADPMTAKASFLAGEGNVIVQMPARDAYDLKQEGYNVVSAPKAVQYLLPDGGNADSPFSDIRVRQAAAYAIDGEALIDAIGYGLVPYTNQIVYPSSRMYNPDIVGYPYNPEKAKELLEEAGYPNGFDTKIIYPSGVGYDNAILIAQEYLSQVGINAELDLSTPTGVYQQCREGWENSFLVEAGFISLGYPETTFLSKFWSQTTTFALSLYKGDKNEPLLDKALNEPDEAKMIEYVQEINRLMIDEYCQQIPLFADVFHGALDPSIHDSKIFSPRMEHWWPEQTWIEQD